MKKFLQDKRANVAVTFGIALTPLILLTGSAVDFSLAYAERDRAQDALDRATLAGAKNLAVETSEQMTSEIQKLFSDFYQPPQGSSASVPTVVVDKSTGRVSSSVLVKTETTFIQAVNINDITSNISSQVAIGNSNFDVVMVLDTSGSMAGSKISTLITAAKDLTTTLMNMNSYGGKTDRVQLAVVPFSGAVNVGPTYGPTYSGTTRTADGTGKAWLDVNTKSSIHNQNWNTGLTANRFDLFAKLQAAYPAYSSTLGWAGCVEMRPYPYSVSDDAPDATKPDTLFVPMFAPDEAGYGPKSSRTKPSSSISTVDNDYLSDTAGSCTTTPSYSNAAGVLEGQGRTCKYNAPATSAFYGTSFSGTFGPNYYCRSKPIQPLTTTKTLIDTKINSLTADGNTDILEGVAWGLRVLSPGAPFTEGRTATTEQPLNKIMIVMTDGDNTYDYDSSNVNKSSYGSYGYLSKNRLNLATTNSSNVLAKQNSLTLEACTNAKAIGTTVYVIAFQVSNSTTINMLKSCATANSYFYPAESNSELLAAFQTIANQISRLRIAS